MVRLLRENKSRTAVVVPTVIFAGVAPVSSWQGDKKFKAISNKQALEMLKLEALKLLGREQIS